MVRTPAFDPLGIGDRIWRARGGWSTLCAFCCELELCLGEPLAGPAIGLGEIGGAERLGRQHVLVAVERAQILRHEDPVLPERAAPALEDTLVRLHSHTRYCDSPR